MPKGKGYGKAKPKSMKTLDKLSRKKKGKR